MRMVLLRLLGLWIAVAAAGGLVAAEELGKGRFLVADRSLTGSGFAESVILLIRYDQTGAMGLIVNRPTPVPVVKVLPGVSALEGRDDRTFIGGPVETRKIFLLLRSVEQPGDAVAVIEDVYFGNSPDLIVAAAKGGGEFRVYAGYAGWGPGQLDAELAEGAWHVLSAETGVVFDGNPRGLWERLIGRTEIRLAGGR